MSTCECPRRSRLLAGGALLLAIAPLPAPAQESVTLRLRYAPGDAFRQTLRMSQRQSSVTGGEGAAPDRAVLFALEVDASGAVEPGAGNDAATVNLKYNRVRIDTESPRQVFHYDTAAPKASDDPETRPLRAKLDRLIGQSLILTLDAEGTVTAVQAPPGLPGGEGIAGRFLDNPLGGMPGLFRAGDVKIGDRWTHELPLEIPLPQGKTPIVYKIENTLKAIEGTGDARSAVILSRVVIEPRDAAPSASQPPPGKSPAQPPVGGAPQDAPVTLDGTGEVTTRFSPAAGKVTQTKGSIDMILRPRPGKLLPGPREIRIRQEFTIEVVPSPATTTR